MTRSFGWQRGGISFANVEVALGYYHIPRACVCFRLCLLKRELVGNEEREPMLVFPLLLLNATSIGPHCPIMRVQ